MFHCIYHINNFGQVGITLCFQRHTDVALASWTKYEMHRIVQTCRTFSEETHTLQRD